ncbi:hypothetical protein BDQ17DRAFT_1412598 [Cyathus striatus]|nr:hypothetical protein BDQ17DRAFT_1412598 [Cyathus striatus]
MRSKASSILSCTLIVYSIYALDVWYQACLDNTSTAKNPATTNPKSTIQTHHLPIFYHPIGRRYLSNDSHKRKSILPSKREEEASSAQNAYIAFLFVLVWKEALCALCHGGNRGRHHPEDDEGEFLFLYRRAWGVGGV